MIGEQADKLGTRAYMEYQTYFQLKNQIHSGISITRDKPVFLITAEEGGNYEAKLVSFQRDLWMVNAYDPLRNKLKVSLESYENNPHESFSLSKAYRPSPWSSHHPYTYFKFQAWLPQAHY